MQVTEWKSTGFKFTKKLPKLAFPLQDALPEIYVPESTILLMQDGRQVHVWLWCYLERKKHGNSIYLFNPSSLSAQRVKDLPKAIERLSKRFRFDNTRPETVKSSLTRLSAFLFWIDDPSHNGRYESILSEPNLALEALKKYHTHLRQRIQANHAGQSIGRAAAAAKDYEAVKWMSVIHDRQYDNEIEIIKSASGNGIKAPKTEDVATFMACMEGVFDSVTRIVLESPLDTEGKSSLGELRWQSGRQEHSLPIPESSNIERVMELGCMAYAALCLGDSGANLAQLQAYEEPEDLNEQLDRPEKLNLRQKVIKLRAGGKVVPFHLTATTVTRLRAYLSLREALRLKLDSPDIAQLFIQCTYSLSDAYARPVEITRLKGRFTESLRSRFKSIGIKLPPVTMRQLRAYKQGVVARKHNPKVSADMMGHSLATQIRNYDNLAQIDCQLEMTPFMARLTSVVLTRAKENGRGSNPSIPLTEIPPGNCENHGHPKAQDEKPLIKPDCKKTEGCFFCDNFHIHDDEKDTTKLMSCRYVLKRMAPGLGDSGASQKVYDTLLSRVNALLSEMKKRNPEAHKRARQAVEEDGHLSPYWATKLQQLHMLALIPPAAPGLERITLN